MGTDSEGSIQQQYAFGPACQISGGGASVPIIFISLRNINLGGKGTPSLTENKTMSLSRTMIGS